MPNPTATDRLPAVPYGFRFANGTEAQTAGSSAQAFFHGHWASFSELQSEGVLDYEASDCWVVPLDRGEWVKRQPSGLWPTPPPESGAVQVLWSDGAELIWRGEGHSCGMRTPPAFTHGHIVAWCIPSPLP